MRKTWNSQRVIVSLLVAAILLEAFLFFSTDESVNFFSIIYFKEHIAAMFFAFDLWDDSQAWTWIFLLPLIAPIIAVLILFKDLLILVSFVLLPLFFVWKYVKNIWYKIWSVIVSLLRVSVPYKLWLPLKILILIAVLLIVFRLAFVLWFPLKILILIAVLLIVFRLAFFKTVP